MASENIKDHQFLDLLDLSDLEVEEWIPDTDEEWAVTNEEDDPEPNHQERRMESYVYQGINACLPSTPVTIGFQNIELFTNQGQSTLCS
ncbi:hypothetical protein PoB_004863900 [Plakobranchus ocellatus]|uniref:Uncharacterized protein n=1 Tax=Plakobranchus ocellatus TaxID=259542 RepID=A0AAV4BTK2_9GAST|nr:hypothetical protein PoB_004863900 [Plakobranchus ocellatus]